MTDGGSDLEDWIRDRFAFLADHGFAVDRVTQYTFQWRNGDRTIELSREPDGQLDLSFARESGHIAWKTRNWPTVVDRYDELQATGTPLTGSEVKRLQYARRHSSGNKT